MKKILIIGMSIFLFYTLTGCTQSFISETGEDVTELERCIDDMVDAGSITACPNSDRDVLIEDYVRSFESQFTQGSSDTINDLTFSTSKDGVISRLEHWFQYSNLPEADGQTNYETYKGIALTMFTEIRQMNDEPEIIFSSEFTFEGHLIYKYHSDKDDNISGEILWLNHTENFTNSFGAISTFLLLHADDDDLILQTYTITSSEHNIKIYIHPVDNTYSYDIYQTNSTDGMTIEQVETLVETTFSSTSLTLIIE